MNRDLLVSTINFNFEFGKRQELYSAAINHFKEQPRPFLPTTFLEIVEVARKRMEEVQKLKEQVSKLEGVILPENYKKIMASIENEEALSSMLLSDTANFLQTQDPKYEESIFSGLEYEQECGMALAVSLDSINYAMGIMITSEVLNNTISLEELMEISNSIEKGTPFFNQLEDLIHTCEKKQEKENTQIDQSPQKEVVTESQRLRPMPSQSQEKVELKPLVGESKKIEPTLADKISQVRYHKGGNMVSEVQGLTIEDRISQIDEELSQLESKPNLSLGDMIHLQTLHEEKIELDAYASTLDKQKLSRSERKRNQKMENVTERLYENAERLKQSQTNSYNSKLIRFISARYQEQLGEQLHRLNAKRGLLQERQRMSAVAKYNRKAGKIALKSRVLGAVRGTKNFASEKIAALKALREQVVQELSYMKQDAGRFFRNEDLLAELQRKTGYSLDQNISIQEHAMQNQQMKAA